MWTILNWANPGSVGTKKQWEGFVAKPLLKGQSKTASPEEHVNAVVSDPYTAALLSILRTYLIWMLPS